MTRPGAPLSIGGLREALSQPLELLGARQLLTPPEVAAMYGCSVAQLYQLVAKRRIGYVKVGVALRFLPTDVEMQPGLPPAEPVAGVPAPPAHARTGTTAHVPARSARDQDAASSEAQRILERRRTPRSAAELAADAREEILDRLPGFPSLGALAIKGFAENA